MKYLKKYNQLNESKKLIESICKKYGIRNYTINSDGSIDVDGSVNLSEQGLTQLPLKFRRVTGFFYCDRNQLTTLVGAPQKLLSFNCSKNQLTSLEGAPQSVGGIFNCSYNQLTSLVGGPVEVGDSFSCNNNKLISLEGGPESVGGDFNCYDNQLTTLEGAPMEVGGDFHCSDNQLTTLEGAPNCKNLYCSGNPFETIWYILFYKDKRFLEMINGMYTGNLAPIKVKDGVNYLRGDVLKEIADELGITLQEDWISQVEAAGYQVIHEYNI